MAKDTRQRRHESTTIPACGADRIVGGRSEHATRRHPEPLQDAFSLYPRLTPCICSSQPFLKAGESPQIVFCADMPWKCPREESPDCNTGVGTTDAARDRRGDAVPCGAAEDAE